MNTPEFLEYVAALSRAKVPIIWVTTVEETRALTHLRHIAHSHHVNMAAEGQPPKMVQKHLAVWSVTEGFRDVSQEEIDREAARQAGKQYQPPQKGMVNPQQALTHIMGKGYPHPALIVFKDLHPLIEDASPKKDSVTIRMLRDVAAHFRESYKTLILLSPSVEVPRDLKDSVVRVDMPLPSKQELMAILNDATGYLSPADLKDIINNGDQGEALDRMAEAGLGLTARAFEDTIARCIVNKSLTIREILRTKAEIIRKSGVLEYIEPDATLADVGGLDNLKAWIELTVERFSPEAEKLGIPKPKGVLLVGPPGTGKTLTAKVIADRLKLPLLRLDASKIVSHLYGQSTQRIAEATNVMEAVAPDVVLIDEYEKFFGAGVQEHEETARTRGTFLTWKQETKAPILAVATCNHDEKIAPEDMQRFQRVFYVGPPTKAELADIIRIHLRKYGQDEEGHISETMLAEHMKGFVGREVDTVISEAVGVAFHEKKPLTFEHIQRVASQIIPTTVQKKAEIDAMKDRLKNTATPASSQTDEGPGEETTPRWKLMG